MIRGGCLVRLFAIAILFSVIFATAVEAFVNPYYQIDKEKDDLIPNISGK